MQDYEYPHYIKPGQEITLAIESRDTEVALLKCYDNGLDSLSSDELASIQRFLDTATLKMTGKI